MPLSDIQRQRIKSIKQRFLNKLDNIDKEDQWPTAKTFKSQLTPIFESYFLVVTSYIERKNQYQRGETLEALIKTKVSLQCQLNQLIADKMNPPKKEIITLDTEGVQRPLLVNIKDPQILEKELTETALRIVEYQRKIEARKIKDSLFEEQTKEFAKHTQLFKTSSLTVIDSARKILGKHVIWQDIFNGLIWLLSFISDAVESFHIKTDAEEMLDTIESSILLAQKDIELIPSDTEYFGSKTLFNF